MVAAEACHDRSSDRSAVESVTAILKTVGLLGLEHRKVETLSGGERRRVEIARCLTTNPKVLLLDEPFAGLDPIVVSELCDLFVGLAKQGFALLITDHAVRETLSICHRVLLLQRGRVVMSGTAEEVSKSEAARHQWLGSRWGESEN
jgi:lipopolysaccharide export system ATP-binding protein